jgi:hypothetical protein
VVFDDPSSALSSSSESSPIIHEAVTLIHSSANGGCTLALLSANQGERDELAFKIDQLLSI